MQKNKNRILFTILGAVLALSCMLCGVDLAGRGDVFASTSASAEEKVLPASYSLFDIDGIDVEQSASLPKRVGNQYGAGICWAFGSLTAFETTLRLTGVVDKNLELNFSEVDMAYNAYVESRDFADVGGGAFEFAYEYLSSGNGVAQEQTWETYNQIKNWSNNSTLTQYYAANIASKGRTYLPYEAQESKNFPSRAAILLNDDVDGVSEEDSLQHVNDLRNSIKSHIFTYGAVVASLYMQEGTYYDNLTNTYLNNNTSRTNHLITIVGWDDNKTDGQGNTGAYICQNSYGESFGNKGYFYVMFADETIEDNVAGFVRVGKIEDEEKVIYDKMDVEGAVEKNQFCTFNGTTSYSTKYIQTSNKTIFANIFEMQDFSDQYVSRLKVPGVCTTAARLNSSKQVEYYPTNCQPTSFNIYIASGISKSDLNSMSSTLASKFSSSKKVKNAAKTGSDEYEFSLQQTGFYCINVNDEIQLTGDYFVVFMQVDANSCMLAADIAKNISHPTYLTSNTSGGSGWGEYRVGSGSSAYVSVLPMIAESKVKGEISYSMDDKNIVAEYDGNAHNPILLVQSPSNVEVEYSIDGGEFSSDINLIDVKWGTDLNGNKVVLPYTIVIRLSSQFYQTKLVTCHVQINPRNLKISPIEKTIEYGETDNQTLTFQTDGLVTGEELYYTGRLQRQPGDNAGQYAITLGDFKLVSRGKFNPQNYTLIFDETKMFTILPKELKVETGTTRKIYGEVDPEISYTFVGMIGMEVPKGEISFTRASGENVGQYDFSLSSSSKLIDNIATGFYASNYVLKIANSHLVISKRTITLKFDQQLSKTYGQTDPEFSFSFENVLPGETAAYSGSLSRESGESVGHYKILPGTFALQDGLDGRFVASNYDFVLQEDYFYITNGSLDSYSFVSNKTVTYNGSKQFLDIYAGESMSVRYCEGEVYDEAKSVSEPIGKIHVGKLTLSLKFSKKDYDDSYATVYIEILPATLTIIPASNQKAIYGEEEYAINFSYVGNAAGEVPNFMGKLEKAEGKDVGEYDILLGTLELASSDTLDKNDYQLALRDGVKFLIAKKELKVVPVENLGKFYGQMDPELIFVIEGAVGTDFITFRGYLSRKVGENVGEYGYVLGSVSLSEQWTKNYYLSSNVAGTFKISPAIVKIKMHDMSAYYGEINLNFVYELLDGTENNIASSDNIKSIVNFVCNDEMGNPISNKTRKNASGYKITAVSRNSNYDLFVTDGTYTINYKRCTVTFRYLEQVESYEVFQFDKLYVPSGIDTNVDGYLFAGWQIGSVTYDLSNFDVVEDVTFVGSYSLKSYSIDYQTNGGSLQSSAKTSFDVTTETFYLQAPVRARYIFEGWFENSDFSGERVDKIEHGTARNFVLYAKWKGEPCNINMPANNEKFDILGGIDVESGVAEFGSNVAFSILLHSGYSKSQNTIKVYAVWASGGRRQLTCTNVTTNHDGVAQTDDPNVCMDFDLLVVDGLSIEVENINKNVYTISYIAGEEIVKTLTLEHGSTLDASLVPEVPFKAHYTQTPAVWSMPVVENIQQDLQITAIYTPNVYVVTFVFEDGQTVRQEVTYGTICSTEKLKEVYVLKFLEHFEFDTPLDSISEDTTINVKIVSNRQTMLIVLGIAGGLIIIGSIVGIVVRRKRHKFNWWSYNK